jgi:hypothetical protein
LICTLKLGVTREWQDKVYGAAFYASEHFGEQPDEENEHKAKISPLDSLATALSSPVPDAGGRLIDQRLALAAVFGRPRPNFQEIVHCFPIAKHAPDRFPATSQV